MPANQLLVGKSGNFLLSLVRRGVLSKYLHSTDHLGYDDSLRCNSRTIFQLAEKTKDLAAKHDDARSVDWTRSHELHDEIPVDIDQFYVTLITSMTVEFCLLSTKV